MTSIIVKMKIFYCFQVQVLSIKKVPSPNPPPPLDFQHLNKIPFVHFQLWLFTQGKKRVFNLKTKFDVFNQVAGATSLTINYFNFICLQYDLHHILCELAGEQYEAVGQNLERNEAQMGPLQMHAIRFV
jgi:hypothetical protein